MVVRELELDQLVAWAAGGDASARDQLLKRYSPLARSRASRLVDQASVDDVVQEAFIEVFATLDRLRHPEALPAWVSLAVRKHADRHRRQRGRTAELTEDAILSEPVESATELSELITRVRAALMTAGDADRRLLELRYLADWSIDDLAQALGVTNGAVRKRLHDARGRLRPALQDLRDRKAMNMTNYLDLLGAVHRPNTLELGDPPAVARPPRREAIPTGLKVLDVLPLSPEAAPLRWSARSAPAT
jgi:RNA polymerase sigma factor (sigma-70 family)